MSNEVISLDRDSAEQLKFNAALEAFINSGDSLATVDMDKLFGPNSKLLREYSVAFAKEYLQVEAIAEEQLEKANKEDVAKVDKLAKSLGFKGWQELCKADWRYEGMSDTGLKGDERNKCDLCGRGSRFLHYVFSEQLNLSLKFSSNCGARFFRAVARATGNDGFLKFNALRSIESRILQDLKAQVFMVYNAGNYKNIARFYYTFKGGNAAKTLVSEGVSGLRRTFRVVEGQDLNGGAPINIVYGNASSDMVSISVSQLKHNFYACTNIGFADGSQLLPLKDRELVYVKRPVKKLQQLDNSFYIYWAQRFAAAGLPVPGLVIDRLNYNMRQVANLYGATGDLDLIELLYSLELEESLYLYTVFSFLGQNLLQASSMAKVSKHIETKTWSSPGFGSLAKMAYVSALAFKVARLATKIPGGKRRLGVYFQSESQNLLASSVPSLQESNREGVTGFTVEGVPRLSLKDKYTGVGGVAKWPGALYSCISYGINPAYCEIGEDAGTVYDTIKAYWAYLAKSGGYPKLEGALSMSFEDYTNFINIYIKEVSELQSNLYRVKRPLGAITSAQGMRDSYERVNAAVETCEELLARRPMEYWAGYSPKFLTRYDIKFNQWYLGTYLLSGYRDDFPKFKDDKFLNPLQTKRKLTELVRYLLGDTNALGDPYNHYIRRVLLMKYDSYGMHDFSRALRDYVEAGHMVDIRDLPDYQLANDKYADYKDVLLREDDPTLLYELGMFLNYGDAIVSESFKLTSPYVLKLKAIVDKAIEDIFVFKDRQAEERALAAQLEIEERIAARRSAEEAEKRAKQEAEKKAKQESAIEDPRVRRLADEAKALRAKIGGTIPRVKYSEQDYDDKLDYGLLAKMLLAAAEDVEIPGSIRSIAKAVSTGRCSKTQINCLHCFVFKAFLGGEESAVEYRNILKGCQKKS